ncbi:oxidoreductase [Novosphingobium sp. KCTC 2891]|uniref:acrylyl-CoA reductase (NADPH) n=1 Tax=Novosphingobium sp. KCTC 2891 TaxID=2989730 RepID=UPI0022228419|nr:MDR family oxidoreductase [Novosphingobium sp. KCTC 2891]MCW1384961.1 oxidoreductase [Novosphingobium sp. KCTC 2891]
MKAIVIEKGDAGQTVTLKDFPESELMDGEVTVRVSHSTINYKDGLALTGAAPIVRRFPMIPGIDFAGVVESSTSDAYKPGDAVLLNGWGTSETHLGAYAEKSRVKADWLVPLPEGLTPRQAMAIGTAGYTAMLSVMAIEAAGVRPSDGPVVVTGAAGGVGSVAIALLAGAGWHVIASTGRTEEAGYLKDLGAAEVIHRDELSATPRPIGNERWAAAVDSVGSNTLANVLAMTKYDGAVAACGLAGGMDLPTSVAPFILRGVKLLGIESVHCPRPRRFEAWRRLAKELDLAKLEAMITTVGLDQVIDLGPQILAGKVRGRVVVEIG